MRRGGSASPAGDGKNQAGGIAVQTETHLSIHANRNHSVNYHRVRGDNSMVNTYQANRNHAVNTLLRDTSERLIPSNADNIILG